MHDASAGLAHPAEYRVTEPPSLFLFCCPPLCALSEYTSSTRARSLLQIERMLGCVLLARFEESERVFACSPGKESHANRAE